MAIRSRTQSYDTNSLFSILANTFPGNNPLPMFFLSFRYSPVFLVDHPCQFIPSKVQHYTWIASQIVVQHHTSFELPSHDAVGGPRLLGSGHFVQLCFKTPRFGAHATCSSCWESPLFLLTKNVLQPLGALKLGSVTLDHELLGTTR